MHPYLPPGTKRQIWAWFFRCTSWHTGYPWVKTLAFRGLIYTSGALCVSRVQKKNILNCLQSCCGTTEVKSLVDVYGSNESHSCLWPCLLAHPSKEGKAGSSAILWPQKCNLSSRSWCKRRGLCTSKSRNLPKSWTHITTLRTLPRQSLGSVYEVSPFVSVEPVAWQVFVIPSSFCFVRQWIIVLGSPSGC